MPNDPLANQLVGNDRLFDLYDLAWDELTTAQRRSIVRAETHRERPRESEIGRAEDNYDPGDWTRK